MGNLIQRKRFRTTPNLFTVVIHMVTTPTGEREPGSGVARPGVSVRQKADEYCTVSFECL